MGKGIQSSGGKVISYCKFLILCEYLILPSCRFVSRILNKECGTFILVFQKIKPRKIAFMCKNVYIRFLDAHSRLQRFLVTTIVKNLVYIHYYYYTCIAANLLFEEKIKL